MPQQGNVSLQQLETITENHSQSKCRVVEPSHMICYTIAPPKAQGSLGRGGWKDCKS